MPNRDYKSLISSAKSLTPRYRKHFSTYDEDTADFKRQVDSYYEAQRQAQLSPAERYAQSKAPQSRWADANSNRAKSIMPTPAAPQSTSSADIYRDTRYGKGATERPAPPSLPNPVGAAFKVKTAIEKEAYTKYNNLSDDDKALVARTYGDGTGYADDYKEYHPRRRNESVSGEVEPISGAEAWLRLKDKYSSEEIKRLRKGYKASTKYGTPITEDEELITKYDSLNGRAKDLLRSMPVDSSDILGRTADGAIRQELKNDYGLTDDEITQLSIYARRKKDADMGNKEFWSEAGKEAAKDDKALASVASIGGNMVSNVTSLVGVLRDVAENRALKNAGYKGDLTLNKDNPLYAMRNYTQGIRGQRAEDLNEAWGTDKAAGFIYQTAMSGADSLMAMSIGSLFPAVNFGGTINGVKNTVSLGAAAADAAYSMGMGGLMLGMGAGVDTMLDLTEKGASAETAVMGGLVSGTFEMLFEDLSISELSTFKGIEALEMAKGWSKQAVKQNVKIAAEKILGSAVTNASEEGLTELANLIYDTLANGDMSQYAEYYNNAIASGMSTDEARKEAFKDMALQVLEAAAGGALMGVGFGVGGAVKLNAQRNTTYAMSPDGLVPVTPKMKGRAISASGRVGETLQAADVVGGTAQEYKDQLVDKAGGSSNLTDKQIGKIALETQFATEGNEEKRKALKSFREEAEVKRANYKQGTTENGNKTRYLITNSPITVDGKETTINGNNKVDTEGEVFTDGKNGLEFKTGDGRTVELTRQTASQIKNEDARNLALFAVNNNLKAKSANLLFNTYDGEFLASDHASAFLNIYRQGSLGTKNKALIKNYSESLSKFTADQVNEIMNAGLEEKKFTPGATDFRVSEKKNNFVNLQVKIMDSIAKALNKELIVTDDLFDEYTREDGTKGYRALNGTYIKGDNRIILSAKADNGLLLSFLAHEMGHEMKNIDSDAFGRLEKVVKSYYTPEEFEEMKAEFVLKGYKESEAEEEIIANALFKVWDKDTIRKVVGKNKSLAVKLYNLVDKISKTYDKAIQRFTTGTDRYGNERNADVKKLLDNKQFMDDVKEVFTEYIGNMQSGKYDTTAEGGLNAIANPAEKEVVKEFGDNLGEVITDGEGDLVLATDKNEETAMYSYSTWQDRGRDELIGLLKAKGHTATEIKDVISQIEDAADYLKILAAGDAKNAGYDALADHLIADVVTDVANGKQIVSALVPNGDYPVNIDLALICKKRVAYMKLLNYLVGEGVLEDVKFGGEAIADVNKILRDSGFETACLGCFVESRRLQIQTWAETIAQEWNAAVEKVRKNAPYFNFSDKEGAANLTDDEINDLESWLNKQTKNDKGNVKAPGKTPTTKAGNLLKMLQETGEGEAFNALAKKITVGDLITPQGLTKLRSVSGELFSFVKSRYGAASPKIVQDFNPYNSEIAMMTFEAVKKITGKSISGSQSYLSAAKEELADSKPPKKDKAGTEKWNADVQNLALQKYFKDIGGIRIQSFSDFMIENVFDYLQIVADLSARDFTMHGYTKEAVALRLFGMTGIKWNGSLIAHVDPKMGKEFAGLMPASEAKAHRGILVKVDGKEYAIGFDDYERHSKFDKNSFIQSIGYKDIVALQCDKRYSPYVGSICIGVSDKQIEAMLDCDLIRMIIPYHASGMLPEFANLIGVDMYTDYTNYQNTGLGVNLFDVNGNPVTELVIGKNEKGEDKYAGNKQVVDHFEWNAKVQELGDAKAAAKAYLEWCQEQHPVFNEKGDLIGYATYEPKFSKFSKHENYYKLLEDFNSYDSITGASAVQDAVKMNLPSKDNKLTAKELAEYKQALKKTGLFSDSEIEKYAKKAQMSFQEIIKEAVDERIAYNKMTEPIKQETFEKVKDLLLTKYNRNGNRAASIDDYLNAQKNPKTKSTLQPVEGAYGDDSVKYSYAGNRAETADRDLLSEAEQMERDGADSETIRQKTGWFRGYDNKWRFEIDDSKATWNNEAKLKTDVFDTGYDYIKLTDLMDHPELYKAYPELKDVKVYIRPSQATSGMVYGGSTSSIFMRKFDPSSQLWRDLVTHELQHIVQNIEDFATGSSQNQFKQLDWGEKEYAAVDKRNEIADKLYAVLRRNGVSISSEAIEDNKYAWTDGFVSSIINDNYFKLQSLAERNPRTKALVDEYYEQVGTLNATTPFGQYMNTAGEIEANDVMSRRRLSAEERKNRRPDIDNPNAIVRGNIGAASYSYGVTQEDINSFVNNDNENNNSLSERGDIDEYEAEQLLNTAKGEDAKAIVDAVDRELLGDAMYYGRKSEQLREEKNAAKKEAKSLNSKVETRNRQIAALRQKVKDQKLADDIYYQRRIKEIRDDRDQKILALKAARRQQDINRRENKLVRDYRSRIQKTYDNLSKELLKPNANRYVPAGLVKTVSDVLGTLSDTLQTTDYYTQGSREGQEIKSRVARNKRLADLKVSYDALANDKNYSQVYDPVISDMIQVMNETIGDKTIEEMNAKELEQVYTVLKAIDHTVRKAAKVEIAGREADAFKLADKSIDQLKEVKKKKINAISKFWYEQLNPRSFFRQLAGYTDGGWMDTYEILNNGQLQQTAIKSEITEAFRELTGDKRARELMNTDKLVDVGLRDAYGKPIPITRGMMISLYMHLQNEDNTRHIERGGLTVPDIDKYYKGDSEAFGNNIARSAGASAELRYLNHQLSELREKRKTAESTMALDAQIEELEERYNIALEKADILSENLKLNIERELTDYDRAWIEKAKWLFDEYSKGKLNEATMRMYGFRKANVENYMPIRTDETDRAPTFEGVKRDVSLENSGFMKDRQKGASNAIYLEDIVDVIQRQMDNVATYSGLAPAVKDFEKIYGKSKLNQDNEVLTTSSVQGAVRDTFGRYGMKYVHDLVTDLQGGRRKEPSIISTLRGNAYQAALTLNLRVAMAQAGSYPTAAAEIGWKPLMQALAKGGEKGKPLSKADRELIAKYTPLLANRINGGHNTVAMGDSGNRSAVDINNLKLMSSKSAKGLNARILNKTAVLTDWIAKVDAATVGRLWYACQYYVDAQSPNLEKGSDEYYQEVAKIFNRVVERTQPSYTTMQRSALLRNPNEAMKLFTMYMTQRAQNFNLVYDSAMEYHTLRQSGASEEKLKESRSKLGRVVSSQLAAGLTLSAMKIVADAIQHSMKGYRDDDDEVTLAKILEKLGLTWLESELSNIFLASEIYSAVSKAITGETYYGISVNVTGALTDLTKSLVTMAQNPSPSTIDKAFRNAATILGIPSSQMKKFADMGIYWFEDIKDGGGIYSYSENGSSVKTETTKMVKQFLNGDVESYRKTREALNGENASTVKSHIVTYLREQYVEDKLTDYEVRRVLESVYGMSSSNIDKKLEEFRQRKNGTYEKKESKKWGEE